MFLFNALRKKPTPPGRAEADLLRIPLIPWRMFPLLLLLLLLLLPKTTMADAAT
jgi:hypothetical protein